jgi:uncharacterized membrane protein YqjE
VTAVDESSEAQPERVEDEEEAGPARALTLHLLRMLETRADAAAIALQSEIQSFQTRLQLRLMAAAAMFIAIWGGIVLLAIVLPPQLRVPVLSAVVAALVIGAVVAHLAAKKKVASREVGSMSWFLDSLRLDFEVLSRSLAKPRVTAAAPPPETPPGEERRPPNDLAA